MPSGSNIAHIKSLKIQYDSLSLVSIKPVYEFENGQTYEPSTQGGPGFFQSVTTQELIFEHGKILVGIKGRYSYDTHINNSVSQFSAITKKSDSTLTTYGPYGKSHGGTKFRTWGRINGFYN